MKSKGFTIVELITTFALTAVIIIILINISVFIRNMYNKVNVKTELLIQQANLSTSINNKLNKNNIVSYSSCSDSNFCYNFNLKDDEIVKLVVTDDGISFGNYKYKLSNGTTIDEPTIEKEYVLLEDTSANNSFLIIKIPIKNKLYPKQDFGINLIYTYNSNNINL